MLNTTDLEQFDERSRRIIRAYIRNPRDVLYLERVGEQYTAQLITAGTSCHLTAPIPEKYAYISGFGLIKSRLLALVNQGMFRLS